MNAERFNMAQVVLGAHLPEYPFKQSGEIALCGTPVPQTVVKKMGEHLVKVEGRNHWTLYPKRYCSGEVVFFGTRFGANGDTHLVSIAYNVKGDFAYVTEYVF